MKHRESINKIAEPELDKETKEVVVQEYNGQFSIKLPKVFVEHWNLKKKEKVKLTMLLPDKGSIRNSKIDVELIEK